MTEKHFTADVMFTDKDQALDAINALRRAGFNASINETARDEPGNDFWCVDVHRPPNADADVDDLYDEVSTIVEPYEGMVTEAGDPYHRIALLSESNVHHLKFRERIEGGINHEHERWLIEFRWVPPQ